ncbi:hypothetical protein OG216_30165 [Streptomycetaceae bacterium NBC_01309]
MSRIQRLRGARPRPAVRGLGKGGRFLVAVAVLAVIFSGTVWVRDQVAEARVPETVCDGLVRTSDVRDLGGDPLVTEEMRREPALGVAELECDAAPVMLRAHPLGKFPDFVRSTVRLTRSGQVPLGAGLQGTADPLRAWLVVPCPSAGSGAPLFVAVLQESWSASGGERGRRVMAETVVRTARAVTERAACGGPVIPDPVVRKAAKPKRPAGIDDRTYRVQWHLNANVPVPSAAADLCGLLPASAFPEPTERVGMYASAWTPSGGPSEFCQMFDENGDEGYAFGVASGDLVPYLREPAGEPAGEPSAGERVGGGASPWLDGMCGGRAVLFHENSTGSRHHIAPPRNAQVLRAFADAYAARHGCSMTSPPP